MKWLLICVLAALPQSCADLSELVLPPYGDADAVGVASDDATAKQATQTSPWGTEVSGLQCRILLPREIEQDMPLFVVVESRCDPGNLPEGVGALDTFAWPSHFTLDLVENTTGTTLHVDDDGLTRGIPFPRHDRHIIPLDGTPIEPRHLGFRLIRLHDELRPGPYDCRITFAPPAEPTMWPPDADPDTAKRLWHGTLVSGTVRLDVRPATTRTQTLQVPKRLRLVRAGRPYGEHLVVLYTDADVQEVTVPVRNGYIIGTYCRGEQRGGLNGGPPRPNDRNGFDQIHQYNGGDIDRSYLITVFETCEPTGHLWAPEICGYTVLWERRFDLHVTADEVAAIRAESPEP